MLSQFLKPRARKSFDSFKQAIPTRVTIIVNKRIVNKCSQHQSYVVPLGKHRDGRLYGPTTGKAAETHQYELLIVA
jgi:hypothetical protein